MREEAFLNKLFHEAKIQIVEPNDNVSLSYKNKSESYLISSKILFENGKPEETVSMAYYSMYYMLMALLFKTGIKCENHSASIILLKRVFQIDNSKIFEAKKERIDKQYYVDFTISLHDVCEMIKDAESFNSDISWTIERMNTEELKRYQSRVSEFLK
jgi:uncharacterized protein (UPF0332 family)